jgi:hypothetical protein
MSFEIKSPLGRGLSGLPIRDRIVGRPGKLFLFFRFVQTSRPQDYLKALRYLDGSLTREEFQVSVLEMKDPAQRPGR